jgi:hypothetical protein
MTISSNMDDGDKIMSEQLSLTGNKIDDVEPIVMEIVFEIREDGSLQYDGKAHPHVSSGSIFGGLRDYESKEQIKQLVEREKRWFASYGRPVIKKITINDKREKQIKIN